jgi:hypothetical protein
MAMNPHKPLNTYLRSANGFKQKKLFKRLLEDRDEGSFIMKNTKGFEIVIPAHFFESAYRRVKNINSHKPLSAKYFSQSEINRLQSFIRLAESKNQNRTYGLGTIQLILDVADSATKQRKHLLKRMNRLTDSKKLALKKGLVDVAIRHNRARVMEMTYQEALDDQKLKFSSRANRYPFVFSILKNNPNRVLINTVYMKGDIYPLNTLIVLGI